MSLATIESVKAVSARLLWSLLVLMAILLGLFVALVQTGHVPTLPIVLIFGALGAFLSLQRRLKELSEEDLQLFRQSLTYTWLAPVAGALLAGVLYLLFIANLLAGQLFPEFKPNQQAVDEAVGFAKIFQIASENPADYAKLLVWSFIAGFSERFVTDIIGRFETQASNGDKKNPN